MKRTITTEQIDALLPQTQCGLCGYKGCRPYARALSAGQETIDRCPPGGVATLQQLANLLNQDAAPFIAAMQQKEKPPVVAKIREEECIGCTKCIQACPVDAILGAAKQMHTVIRSECTGCELCIEPCPVDCIDLIALTEPSYNKEHARKRYEFRNQRLGQKPLEKSSMDGANPLTEPSRHENIIAKRRNEILAAVARVKNKK